MNSTRDLIKKSDKPVKQVVSMRWMFPDRYRQFGELCRKAGTTAGDFFECTAVDLLTKPPPLAINDIQSVTKNRKISRLRRAGA
jgi:hypothetical protein